MTRLVLNRTNRSRPRAAAPAGRIPRTGGWFSEQPVRAIRRAQILDFFENRPPGRVLDAPAGSLWLARALADRRFEVHALDLLDQESSAAAAGIRYVRGNLDQGLPQFGDQTFDYLVCTEGLEHLEHPALLLREFARVLRPLGTLLVTTPNVVSLRSRLKFLLFGYFDGFRRRALFRSLGRPRDLETPHISPIHIQFLYYWLVGAGFTHIHVYPLPVHRLERLALQPLAALVTALGWAARDPGDRYQAEFRTLLLSRPLLFSPTVILTAQRAERAGGGAESE
jgi:ubiquinone/menaquinone biosynthesis C-methylase UbiE